MPFTIIFFILLLAVLFSWYGARRTAICVFILSLILSSIGFISDITQATGIQL